MKRLMLDYLGRWSLVLGAVAAAQLGLGWFIAAAPELPFEFWAFMLTMWSGAVLLSFDLRRGVLRSIAVLPLTGRQIGQGWWLASVPIPAVALAALLFLGAAAGCRFHPGHAFPVERLTLASLFMLVWLGMEFTMGFAATRGFGRNRREFISNSLVSVFSSLMFFGSMLLCQGASKNLVKTVVLLGGGAILTALGWVLAERFEPGLAGLYLGRLEPPQLGGVGSRPTPSARSVRRGLDRVPSGYGGVSWLLRTSCWRSFVLIAGMVSLVALLAHWQSQRSTPSVDLVLLGIVASFLSCWFVLFNQFMPQLGHLRFLRTLPISATGLAAVLLALPLLPLAALGVAVAVIAWLASGPASALTILNSCTYTLAPAAWGVWVAVWRGAGTSGYALVILTQFVFFAGRLWLQWFYRAAEAPLGVVCAIAMIGVLCAFGLTRLALDRSRHSYRVQAAPLGSFPWGAAR